MAEIKSERPLSSGRFLFGAVGLLLCGFGAAGCSLLAPGPADGPAPGPGATGASLSKLPAVDFLLIGEQHDADEHHRIEREAVQALAAQGRLAALAVEMAEQGRDTRRLGPDAEPAQVREALAWSDRAWPWSDYGPVVMAAVEAGVPVLGANLPRARMKDAMADVSLDAQLSADARKAQEDAVRDGHCNLLPESQIQPMTRVQVARDRAMALTLAQARLPGKTVILVSGAGHIARGTGVPQHLPTDMKVLVLRLAAGEPPPAEPPAAYDATWTTPALPPVNHCAELRNRPR